LAFLREYEDEHMLVIANLSRFSQAVEFDLSRFAGYIPEEVVSGNKFPSIKQEPYVLTLGFHNYYWFLLKKEEQYVVPSRGEGIPEVVLTGRWESILQGKQREHLERAILPSYLAGCRWFGAKARVIQQVRITDVVPIGPDPHIAYLLFLEVRYTEGSNEMYLLPVSFGSGDGVEKLKEIPQAVIMSLKTTNGSGVLVDAVHNEGFRAEMFRMLAKKRSVRAARGEVTAYPGEILKKKRAVSQQTDQSRVLKAEQSNTSILYGNEFFFKLYRRLDEGINPDLEMGRFLTEQAGFRNTPAYAGAIEYRRTGAEPMVLGVLQQLVPNEGDAWAFSLTSTGRYFESVLARRNEIGQVPVPPTSLVQLAAEETPAIMQELIGGVYLEMIRLLGCRTAEMHLALASAPDDPRFAPEAFSLHYQRSLYHSMRTLTKRVFELLKKNLKSLPDEVRSDVQKIIGLEKEIITRFSNLFGQKIPAMKTRMHGDYHLGQVLFTGNDFVIIDFEGEPARTIGERRLKRSPLRDVAGMIRSFHYPTYSYLFTTNTISPEDRVALRVWADLWYKYVSGVFLKSYLATVGTAPFIPKGKNELELMLNAYLLEKAIYEVGYELNNRPGWVVIPVHGITYLLEG
ncbi:MAG: putative maltokinase, partial [Ignavibacteria bacterium]|nr:putative maltokinase [Ignavibacteria bacterium]